jgi:hypothetical protein
VRLRLDGGHLRLLSSDKDIERHAAASVQLGADKVIFTRSTGSGGSAEPQELLATRCSPEKCSKPCKGDRE